MLFSKKRAKRFLAILLAAMLVFANDSALTAVALTAAEGEEIVNDANVNNIEQYEEAEDIEEILTPEELEQEESEEELQGESEEELQGESEEELQEESEEELQGESEGELQEESEEELQEESEEELQEESEEGLQEESEEALQKEFQKELTDEFQRVNLGDEFLAVDSDLLSAETLFGGMTGFMLMSAAPQEDYYDFFGSDDYPIIVEVEVCNYDRGEGDFPVTIGSATGNNVIDGGDKIKARVSGDSVILSWSSDNAPREIRIEGEPEWDTRDISVGQTSVTIDFETERDFYYIQADYGNGGGFGPTEEKPYFIEILTEGIGHVEVPDGYPEEDYFAEGNMLQIRSASPQIVVDVFTNDDEAVEHNITGLYRHFEESEDDAYNYEDITAGICQWAAYNAGTKKLTFTLSSEDREFWGVFVTFEGGGFGPTEEKPYFIEILTEGIGHVEVPDGYPEEDYFAEGNMLQIRSASPQIVVDVFTNDDEVVEHNITGLYRHFEDPEDPENAEKNYDERYSYEQITGSGCQWAAYNAGTKKLTFTLSSEDMEFWGVFVTFEGAGDNDITYSSNDTISENLTKDNVTVENNVILTIGNVRLRIDHQLDVRSSANVVGTSSASILEIAGNGAITLGLNLYDTSGNQISSGDDNHFQNNGEGTVEFVWNTTNGRWETNQNQPGGGGDHHNIGVDFLNDLSALPGDDTAQLCLDIVGRQSDNGIIYLDSNTDHWEFGKGSDGQHMFNLSVPDNAVSLGFRLSTGGKAVKEAFYVIGEDKHNLTETEIADLTSDSYFNIRVNDGENWVELIVFSIVLEEGNQPGGGGGNDYDVTYSENTRISEDLSKNDITVDNNVTLTIDNCKVQINHKLTVKSGANVVGTSADSVLEITGKGQSEGITLYRTNGDVLTIGTNFGNDLDEPIDFRWNTTLNRWETEQNPFSGYDLPWYTISYGNSANLTTENGQVYAIRVHVGDITYSSISSEYNASETDKIYSMEDTIFHQKTQEEENDPEYQDSLMRFGIGGSDGDIMFKSDLSGASIDFKFIPDFGYQLENIYTNENNGMLDEFAAAETISTFTFNVVQGKNVHFIVRFVEANNTVTGNAGISSQATIESSNAASSGALEMTVDTATPNSNIPQGSEALAAYDITLKNVVSKGEGRGNWETALTDLGSNSATVTLPVSDTTNYTYTVIREHDGQTETLEATITDGGISFETNKFSTYTIVKRPVAASIATATVTLGDALTYNGTLQTQSVASVKLGEVTLNASTDYEITDVSETDAGTYTLTITGKGDYKGTVTKQFTIAKKELTPSITGTVTKAYDGNKDVNDASSLSVSLAGKCGSDDVSATVAKYEYDSADVGTGKTITATGIALSGAKAVNYELTVTTATATVGEVTKVTPELTLTGLQETTLSPVGVKGVLTPPDENANVIVEYKVIKTESVSGEDPEYEWTTTRPVTPGTYDVRATLPEATDNLNAVTTPVTGTYKLTQYVAPAPGENNNETESAETETKEETIEVETKTSAGNAVTAEPDIIEAEPLVSAEEPLIVPAENIEAEMPEGISEEAKEELVEQVAETVSELVEAILDGDEAVENAVSEETLENIKTALDEGKSIIAVVKVEVVDESSIPSEDKASIEKVLESQEENNIEIACYLDLSIMLKTTDGEELGTYNELTGMVSFTIEAPEDMTCSEGQEYVVIRIHNGESTIIPVTVNPDGTLSFETDRFSSYALAIRDVVKEAESVSLQTETKVSDSSTESAYTKSDITEVADTKVNFWVYALIALGVLLIAAGIIFGIKKVKSE